VDRLSVSVRSQLRGIREALASLVFPAPCRICARMLDTGNRIPFCRTCVTTLMQELSEPLCARCGRPMVSPLVAEGALPPRCRLCRLGAYDFDFARSFGAYSPAMARAILLLKYSEITPLGGWFAKQLTKVAANNREEFAADVVVPVPLHPTRLRERGYNQAELIAKPLARYLGIPFRSYFLVRTRPPPDKIRLTRRERWETVRGAYVMHQRAKVDKMGVLLVDDVFTTGATLDACSRALRRAGAVRVAGITVARAFPSSLAPDAAVKGEDQSG
jgi:competence protein ComFC